MRQLTANTTTEDEPSWSPDGRTIAFTSDRDPVDDSGFAYDIYTMRADGGRQTRLTVGGLDDFAPSWSPDGRTIAVRARSATRRSAGASSTLRSTPCARTARSPPASRRTWRSTASPTGGRDMPRRLKSGLLACIAALLAPAAAHADPVSDWNAIASTAIVTTAGQSAHASSLSYAMVQGAVYDAVNAIDRTHRPYLVSPPAKRSDSKEAAVATAAYRVLAALFPAQLATLQPRYDAAAGGDSRRPSQGRWHRGRRSGRGRDARRPRRRRPRRAVLVRARHRAGGLAADAAELRARSRPVGGQRPAVRRAARSAAALRLAEPAHQPRLCARPQRGQAGGLAGEHDPQRRPDRGGDLLAGPPARDLEPRAAVGRGNGASASTSATAPGCSRP